MAGQKSRPYVLSIAGHDPSGGAGILADCKAFERHAVQGFCVATAITYQTEDKFEGIHWLSLSHIINQLKPLCEQYAFDVVKIGLVKDAPTLIAIIKYLLAINSTIKIIWDPILKASAGFLFNNQFSQKQLVFICQNVMLITPNKFEMDQLGAMMGNRFELNLAAYQAHWFIKSYQAQHGTITDILITKKGITPWKNKKLKNKSIHGSGCILSASIAAHIALGFTLEYACEASRAYVYHLLKTSQGQLAKHY